jgi:L-asparaginase
VATGGTIAWHEDKKEMLTAAQLCADAVLRVAHTRDADSQPSWEFSINAMTAIATSVCGELDRGADAVVVTHGTDTLEETAWLTELLLGPRRGIGAVVFTGAMRFWDHVHSDGPRNIRDAVVAASSAVGQALGVQVVMAGRTHAARWVRKVDAVALDCFDSDGRPPTAHPPPEVVSPCLAWPVPVVKVGPFGPDHFPGDVAGLVLEGTGAAHIPTRYDRQIQDLGDRGIPVVLATRCRDVPRVRTRAGPVFHAGDLTAEKAALALMVALGQNLDSDALKDWWAELMVGGIAPGP